MEKNKMSFNAAWCMAVGGMIGGGIFSVLGVIIETSGQWAWLSFIIAGIIALISAHSYNQLTLMFSESGGVFTFLRRTNKKSLAASLAWMLILGYILTISVYAFTFGHYVSHVFNTGRWLPNILAFLVIAALTLVNLRGVGDASRLEIVTVWGKLFILVGLSLFGIFQWNPEQLTSGIEIRPWHASIIGAATIFMAYEGFQLLYYDYDEMQNPQKNLPRATISAVITVIIVYVFVALGAIMLVGSETLIAQKEVALSIAGQKALGSSGLVLVTIAAAFSTGSAINATLFSTARLMERVAEKKDLPQLLSKINSVNVPYVSIIVIAGLAALMSNIGSLEMLVDAASLIFLITFGTVNYIAWHKKVKYKFVCLAGSVGCVIAIVLASYEQYLMNPIPLVIILVLIIMAIVGRRYFLKRIQ
jgi:amino acid transporter